MNCPATLGCFCLSRTKLDNYYCVQTHCVGLTLLTCYPTFLLKKKELEQARQLYLFCARKKNYMRNSSHDWCLTLSENGLPQRHAVGTFDVCLVRPKVCPTDIVRPHAAQLMVDTSVNQFCQIWPSVDWLLFWPLWAWSDIVPRIKRQSALGHYFVFVSWIGRPIQETKTNYGLERIGPKCVGSGRTKLPSVLHLCVTLHFC